MTVATDWTIDTTNLRVYHSLGTTVYSVNALYSHIMDYMDELPMLSFTMPMNAQTPTAYTMINGWFIDDVSTQYLLGGAIATSGYAAGVIRMLTFVSAGYTSAASGDLGLVATGAGGSTGTLLSYNNTTRKWWVRTLTGVFGVAEVVSMIPGGGTGVGTTAGASVSGEELYANVYTLGTIDSSPYPQIYIYQSGAKLTGWANFTLTNFDRGQIDVLIKVQEMGTLIDSANIVVYARQYTDTYANFDINLAAGGRNAVPLATAKDLNNTTGEYYLFYDGAGSNFVALNQIVSGAGGASAQLVAVTAWDATTGVLTLCGVNGVFVNNEAITGSVNGARFVNGTLGDTYLAFDNQTVAFTTLGQTLTGATSGAKRLVRGIQDDVGVVGKLCLQVNSAITGVPKALQYLAFANNEVVSGSSEGSADADGASTTIVAGYSDIAVTFVNGTATHGAIVGTFLANEPVTYTGGTATGGGIFLLETAGTMTIGNSTATLLFNGGGGNESTITGTVSGATCDATADLVSAHTMDKTFPSGSPYPYDVIVDCAGRRLTQVYEYFKFTNRAISYYLMYTVVAGVITPIYGEEYIIAYTGYTPVTVSPFGTFAGGKLFGAQGVWVEDMNALDIMNYQLIDSNGVTRAPPTYAVVSVTSLVAGDRVTVFRTTAGVVINKAMYTSDAALNVAGDSTYVTDGAPAIAVDTPNSGALRLVTVATAQEYRMRYASWTASTFTLLTAITGLTTAPGTETLLVDGGVDFTLLNILPGDICRDATTGEWAQVVSTANGSVVTTPLSNAGTWGAAENYEFHTLPVTFIATDKAYVPFIDEEALGTTSTVTVIYTADRTVVIRVRKKFILPFETPNTVTSTGMSQSAIRTPDSIVT